MKATWVLGAKRKTTKTRCHLRYNICSVERGICLSAACSINRTCVKCWQCLWWGWVILSGCVYNDACKWVFSWFGEVTKMFNNSIIKCSISLQTKHRFQSWYHPQVRMMLAPLLVTSKRLDKLTASEAQTNHQVRGRLNFLVVFLFN